VTPVDFDLGAVRARLAVAGPGTAGTAGPLQPVGMSEVHIGPGAADRLGEVVAGLAGRPGPIVVLAAATPISVRGATVRDVVEERAGSCSALQWVVLGPADGCVHADERTVADAGQAAAGARCVITVGSGTISDIGKAAAPEGVPLIAVQTATSVNGYADPFSVLLKAGVKRTTPTRWPDVLIADSDVLLDAPDRLSLAGIGDMAAMFTAAADWYVASQLRTDGPPYLSEVSDLVRPHGEGMLGHGAGLAADPGRLADLARLLTLSGIAMGVAGSTAPASGMEHAVSHLLEMRATASDGISSPGSGGRDSRGHSLHGEQVGVASVVAAAAWVHVRERVAAGWLDRTARLPDPDLMADRIEAAFGGLDPTGAMAAECLTDYAAKIRLLAASGDPLETLRTRWAECDTELGRLLIGPADLAAGLVSAGLPARFGDLPEPVGAGVARWAVANCPLQRRRFGAADLAMLMGAWEEEDVAAVLAAAESAVPAAERAP
jgi:glycerol-1-phosphate dehydrogenase [NAD(P)+]